MMFRSLGNDVLKYTYFFTLLLFSQHVLKKRSCFLKKKKQITGIFLFCELINFLEKKDGYKGKAFFKKK